MRIALVLIGLCLLPSVALAASRADQRKAANLVREAGRHYNAGQYAESAEALEQAYALDPHPRILYNLARAYDQAGELEKALETYQRYIGSNQGTDATLLKRSSLAADRLRGLVAERQEAREKAEAERKRLEAEAQAAEERARLEAAAKREAEAVAERQRREQVLAAQQGHDRAQLAAFISAGVGVAALGTGGFFGFQALQTGRGETGAVATAETFAEKEAAVAVAKQQALVADVAFGIGAAAAVAAVLFWPKEARPDFATVAIGPGGAFVEVRF